MIEAVIKGDRELVAELSTFPQRLQARLERVMRRLGIQLQGIVKGQKLSGQVLKNRTGHLRASIGEETVATADGITTTVGVRQGPTVIYGRAHEFGFDGVVTVRDHLRTIKQAFGRSITPRTVEIPAHSRHMHLPERSFLRSALQDFFPTAVATLERETTELAGA